MQLLPNVIVCRKLTNCIVIYSGVAVRLVRYKLTGTVIEADADIPLELALMNTTCEVLIL